MEFIKISFKGPQYALLGPNTAPDWKRQYWEVERVTKSSEIFRLFVRIIKNNGLKFAKRTSLDSQVGCLKDRAAPWIDPFVLARDLQTYL